MKQHTSTSLLLLLLLTIKLVVSDVPEGVVRCFDCNYNPDYSADDQEAGANPGFQRCSLGREDDSDFVDKWPCMSGTCFIRKDGNGLIYRGCADKWNLPWGIDTSASCSNQGSSLWWFCRGNLCNSGHFGQQGVCPGADLHIVDAMEKPPKATNTANEHMDSEDALKYVDNREGNEYAQNDAPNSFTSDLGEDPDAYNGPQSFYNFLSGSDDSHRDHEAEMTSFHLMTESEPAPMLVNQEFVHLYHSLIPRADMEHQAGLHTVEEMASQESKKSDDHHAVKSWQPDKSAESVDTYHKSWDGDAYSGSNKKSSETHQGKTTYGAMEKSHQPVYGDHTGKNTKQQVTSKSAAAIPPKKSVYAEPKKQASQHYKSPMPVPSVKSLTSGNSKKSYEESNHSMKTVYHTPSKTAENQKSTVQTSKYNGLPPLTKSQDSQYNSKSQVVYHPMSAQKKSSNTHKSSVPVKSTQKKSQVVVPAPNKSGHKSSVVLGPKSTIHHPVPNSVEVLPVVVGDHFLPPKGFYNPPVHADYIFYEPRLDNPTQSHKESDVSTDQNLDSISGPHADSAPAYVVPLHPPTLASVEYSDLPGVPQNHPGNHHMDLSGDYTAGMQGNSERHQSTDGEAPDAMSSSFGDYWFRNYYRGERAPPTQSSETTGPSDEQHVNHYARHTPSDDTDDKDDKMAVTSENPCKSDCADNQRGIFPHPIKEDWFIQCGAGVDSHGVTCSCCKAYYMRCPYGTRFDLISGGCGIMSEALTNYA